MASSAENVQTTAEALVEAVRAHAEAMVSNGPPPEVMPAINALAEAARNYTDAVFDHTGWGNVFALVGEDDE